MSGSRLETKFLHCHRQTLAVHFSSPALVLQQGRRCCREKGCGKFNIQEDIALSFQILSARGNIYTYLSFLLSFSLICFQKRKTPGTANLMLSMYILLKPSRLFVCNLQLCELVHCRTTIFESR